MIEKCFSNPGSPVSSSTTSTMSSSKGNLVTSIYQTRLLHSPIQLTLTWFNTPGSHSVTIHAPHFFSLTIPLFPSSFYFFPTRPGSKSVHLTRQRSKSKDKIKLYWDFTRAEFTRPNSAEPESRFYFAITHNERTDFFLGDLWDEFARRVGHGPLDNSAESTQLSRREHLFGRRSFSTRAELLGRWRLIDIECAGGVLKLKVDGETKLAIKRLAWKFRGNERVMIDGVGVEFFWDVFNWVSDEANSPIAQKKRGNGVFVLQVGEGGVWPEMVGPEKRLMGKSSLAPANSAMLSPAGSCSSVLQWAEESSDCGRSSSGSSSTTASSGSGGGGFSLVIYAWRKA